MIDINANSVYSILYPRLEMTLTFIVLYILYFIAESLECIAYTLY